MCQVSTFFLQLHFLGELQPILPSPDTFSLEYVGDWMWKSATNFTNLQQDNPK